MYHRFVFKCAALALCAGLVAGCTTLSPEEQRADCAAKDWQRFGVNDGVLGVPASDRAGLFQDCATVGAPVNVAVYQAGRSEGLKTYCTAPIGYDVGYRGLRYRDVCPPALEPDFLQGFERGRRDRPALTLRPRFGIGIGSGGVRTGIGIGIGLGSFSGHYLTHCHGYGYPWLHRHC